MKIYLQSLVVEVYLMMLQLLLLNMIILENYLDIQNLEEWKYFV